MKRRRLKLILASASPRRKSLMRQAGFRFVVLPSRIKERFPRGLSPRKLVERLALQKAMDVARRHPAAIVLGADTLVFVGGKIIGKPRDQRHARRILARLSGRWQKVYTGVAVVLGKKSRVGCAVSDVKIRPLSEQDIRRAAGRHLDKAGAYAVQEKRDPFVEKIRGDYDNVVGLPMKIVRRLLGAAR